MIYMYLADRSFSSKSFMFYTTQCQTQAQPERPILLGNDEPEL